MTLTTSIIGDIKFNLLSANGAQYDPTVSLNDSLASGVGLDAGDLLYYQEDVALGGSATNTLDVAGSVTDELNNTITCVKIKLFYFHNKSTTAGNTITLGNDANEVLFWSAAGTQTVGPNGRIVIWEPSLAGIAVTAGTGDVLSILNNTANAITYDIAFVGTSA